jgi:thiamine pyrophosphate-dependent acetolactate synthase large subunit-like protein
MTTREEAIARILDKHGTGAVYVASTGYVSRAVYALAGDEYSVFYMQGSMGLAPAIGLGIAMSSPADVVVFNGDGALLMSMGTTHTARELALPNFFHYVLDNGCHESVGGQRCARLDATYPGVTEVIRIDRGHKPPRVGVEPPENTLSVRSALQAVRS